MNSSTVMKWNHPFHFITVSDFTEFSTVMKWRGWFHFITVSEITYCDEMKLPFSFHHSKWFHGIFFKTNYHPPSDKDISPDNRLYINIWNVIIMKKNTLHIKDEQVWGKKIILNTLTQILCTVYLERKKTEKGLNPKKKV